MAGGWVLANGRRAEVGLADAGVADEHHLEEVVVLVLRPVPTSIGSHCFPSPPQAVRPPLVSLGQGWPWVRRDAIGMCGGWWRGGAERGSWVVGLGFLYLIYICEYVLGSGLDIH